MIVIGRAALWCKLWNCPWRVDTATNLVTFIFITTTITTTFIITTTTTMFIITTTIIIFITTTFVCRLCPRTLNTAGKNGLNPQPQIHNTSSQVPQPRPHQVSWGTWLHNTYLDKGRSKTNLKYLEFLLYLRLVISDHHRNTVGWSTDLMRGSLDFNQPTNDQWNDHWSGWLKLRPSILSLTSWGKSGRWAYLATGWNSKATQVSSRWRTHVGQHTCH